MDNKSNNNGNELQERLVKLNRVTKVLKGGRAFSFSALAVVGDMKGNIGFGLGKASDASEAIKKAMEKAKKNMIHVPLKKNTLPHEVIGNFKSASVLIKPACEGTGIIAGGCVRVIMDVLGVQDILCKSLGSKNNINILRATFNGLASEMDARVVAKNRGKNINEMWG